jgi:hypothetical protein
MAAHEMVNWSRLAHLIGYIGEYVVEDCLRNLGFNAYSMGNSGMSSRIGDLLIQRTWFHTNGYCEGHTDTFGVEVKTTLSNKFQGQLSPRQKKMHKGSKRRLPVLLVRIIQISSHGISYEVKEIPEAWTSSSYLLDWKESPRHYETNAPRKCHQKRAYPCFTPEHERQRIEYLQKKTIKHFRNSLRTMNYFNVYPFLKADQASLNKYQASGS